MADPIAVWGAVTGTTATGFAIWRELYARRLRLTVEHGVHLQVSTKASGEISDGWLVVRVWNSGGRETSVERIGIYWLKSWIEGETIHLDVMPHRAQIELVEPIQLAPGGPSNRLHTPLASVIALGIDPIEQPIWAWVQTTDGREWVDEMHPIIQIPPPVPKEQFEAFLKDQAERASMETPTSGVIVLPARGPEIEG